MSKSEITSAIDSQSDINAADSIIDSQVNITNGLINADLKSVATAAQQTDEQTKAKVLENYGQLPLHFESNNGQIDNEQIRFSSRGQGYNLFLSPTKATLALRQAVNDKTNKQQKDITTLIPQIQSQRVKAKNQADNKEYKQAVVEMQIVGANKLSQSIGTDELEGKSNYFIGNDQSKWKTDVANYKRVRFQEVYAGINVEYYGNQRQLEYDFVVAPNADASQIKLKFTGVTKVKVEKQSGELILQTNLGEVRQKKPFVYQTNENGERTEVASNYKVKGREVSFELGEYDRNKQITIDPVVLVYSSFLGGSKDDSGTGIAVDIVGNAYVTGYTQSANFPTTNARQAIFGGGNNDAFITKINSSGSALVYSTYLGGNGLDGGAGIAVDAAGNAYVTGYTGSPNFPIENASQATYGGGVNIFDAFITKINSSGNALVYSTYLGGNNTDLGRGIAVDIVGNAYVTGYTESANFPTANARQATRNGSVNAFITKINSTGSALVYSTYHGGSRFDSGFGIAVDAGGNAYVTGSTSSTDFPTANAKQATFGGGFIGDAFITKINSSGSELVYSTYHGGSSNDSGKGIAVDRAGNAYITGNTESLNFPTANARQATFGGFRDVFITKINSTGSALVYSTYHGGSGDDSGSGIAVDTVGNAYVTGSTGPGNPPVVITSSATGNAYVTGDTPSISFPTANARQTTFGGGFGDAFITKINSSGSELVYSTYHGGSGGDIGSGVAVDSSGNAYITGVTTTITDFPIINNRQPAFGGGFYDAFISKFAERRAQFDFDGDGKTDISIFQPTTGEWRIQRSSDQQTVTFTFGNSSDRLVPADYTGDGKTDVAVFRPQTGEWFILRSEDNSFFSFPFGISEDIPAPADYDADGKADAAVFRPSSNTWFISRSSGGTTIQQFGISGDVPVTADYDGDGKSDLAIYRPSQGQWWLLRSSLGIIVYQFGSATDKPVQGDYTGDGKADVAFFNPHTNEWFILRSENGSFYSFSFGAAGDVPSPGDYDGDGKMDAGIFRSSNNTWFVQGSTSGSMIQGFGQAGDKPVPNAFVP